MDNVEYGDHQQALAWLAENFTGPLHVATGYVSLEGLDALAELSTARHEPTRLLIGVAPETLVSSLEETVADRFKQSVSALRRQRDFSAFPAARRVVLERVANFLESDDVAVRRYIRRFLHGKAYLFGQLNDEGSPIGLVAALVTSAT